MSRLLFAACCAAVLVAGGPALAIPQPPHDLATHGVSCGDCHVPYGSLNAPAVAQGSVTGSTLSSLTDSAKTWAANEWVGGVVTITSGANLGQFRAVTASSANTLSWALPLPFALANTDAYQLGKTTYRDIETKCKTCHNPTGMASTLPNVGLHVVNETTIIGCGKCHDPHNTEANSGAGNRILRTKVRWPTAVAANVFPSGGANRLIAGAAPFNGICETCHTNVAHHQNNASQDHSHQAAQDCTAVCHKHSDGFGVNCLGCHATAQGTRRAVVGEFPAGNAHAHYGVTVNNATCRVCHNNATHGDGFVDLVDPDDATHLIRFQNRAAAPASPELSTFCMNCHDADGAKRLSRPFDPFGNGNVAPNVADRFKGTLQWSEWYGDWCWGEEGTMRKVNSHHDISAADQAWSGAQVGCLSCHGAHTAASTQKLNSPVSPLVPWAGTSNGFCLSCHNGGAGPLSPGFPAGVVGPTIPMRGIDSCGYNTSPWWVAATWTHSSHGPDSKRPWAGYSGAPGADMDCVVCHDPHGSYTPSNPAGNPYAIRDGVDGTAFVDDGSRYGWNGPPWTTFGVSRPVKVAISGVTVDWGGTQGLCSACHVNWYAASTMSHDCGGCQTCHGHGQNYGENDWGTGPSHNTWCP